MALFISRFAFVISKRHICFLFNSIIKFNQSLGFIIYQMNVGLRTVHAILLPIIIGQTI